ncbi:MAG TPA: alanine--tRNA ligase, partial [Dehalococcoidia bacterium]|nr:alanine--tRNA ligase [Dehalococcoidia bacterium]
MPRHLTADQLREAFLRFFESKGHVIVSSSPLIPQGDPTLLFTTAGMVQMKPYFMQEATPPKPRLTSSQKCFRTTDIEQVGNLKHLTFFEMLGNFSVGDYFKREATAWAWEFVTQRLELPEERLWTTVYTTDDEAYACWTDLGVPPERIVRYGEVEGNFWGPAGDTGPCGPCSEIHYDFGAEQGCGQETCGPACDCGRFLEIWNLVFMELYQDAAGNRTPLPRKNIDTGMGLERTVTLLQGKQSVYDTDVFGPIIDRVADLAGRRYGDDPAADRAIRVLAEHGRAVAFLIGDGVIPSNEGRGYVLRRVLRRALRFARSLGLTIGASLEAAILIQVVRAVLDRMGDVYPSLVENQAFVERVVASEEAKFARTLEVGLTRLDDLIAATEAGGARELAGEEVFRLYDTYGFPVELTAELAEERGLAIDRTGFAAALDRQREQARQAAKFGGAERAPVEVYHELNAPKAEFLGYQTVTATSRVTGLIAGGQPVDRLEADASGEVVLAATPFYAEAGGQVGDTGWIASPTGRFEVTDTTRPVPDLIVHHGRLVEGSLALNEEVEARVDVHRRLAIGRNHTATHLLHAALRKVLGGHVQQAGSLVAPERLRFD